MSDPAALPETPLSQDTYIVSEGKKRGATRDVRGDASHDRFYKVVRVHPGDAILTNNWHTNEVFQHARKNFEGHTFTMRTLEAWGASIEDDRRAYYTAGGRTWVLDLEPATAKTSRPSAGGAARKTL
jgi:hypothetical protein